VVIYLGISEEEAIRRLLARGRADDQIEVIKRRLETHEKYMGEVLEFFEKTGKLHRVNGEQSVDVIVGICEKIIEESDESTN
jgi:adenylate kinase